MVSFSFLVVWPSCSCALPLLLPNSRMELDFPTATHSAPYNSLDYLSTPLPMHRKPPRPRRAIVMQPIESDHPSDSAILMRPLRRESTDHLVQLMLQHSHGGPKICRNAIGRKWRSRCGTRICPTDRTAHQLDDRPQDHARIAPRLTTCSTQIANSLSATAYWMC